MYDTTRWEIIERQNSREKAKTTPPAASVAPAPPPPPPAAAMPATTGIILVTSITSRCMISNKYDKSNDGSLLFSVHSLDPLHSQFHSRDQRAELISSAFIRCGFVVQLLPTVNVTVNVSWPMSWSTSIRWSACIRRTACIRPTV
jgi:hypothetical protein